MGRRGVGEEGEGEERMRGGGGVGMVYLSKVEESKVNGCLNLLKRLEMWGVYESIVENLTGRIFTNI